MINGALILAAGTGSRMESRTSKLLQNVAGKPMILWVKEALQAVGAFEQVYVVGYQQAQIRLTLGEKMIYMFQDRPLGTGHATGKASSFLEGVDGATLVCPADIPLIRPQTLTNLVEAFEGKEKQACVFLTAYVPDNGALPYERVVRDAEGKLIGLQAPGPLAKSYDFLNSAIDPYEVQSYEQAERAELCEVNSGIYCFDTSLLLSAIGKIGAKVGNDTAYELSDIIALLLADGHKVSAIRADAQEVLGVKTRIGLDRVVKLMNRRICAYHLHRGVSIVEPATCSIDWDVNIGADSEIGPHVVLKNGTQIGNNCIIGAFSNLSAAIVGDDSEIKRGELSECKLGQRSKLASFVEVRQSVLQDDCKIDSFSLLQNCDFGNHVQVADHASLANVRAYENAEFAAGVTVTDHHNADKRLPNFLTVGQGAFIGADSTLIAPKYIGEYSYVTPGSVITQPVPDRAKASGRAEQVIVENWDKSPNLQKASQEGELYTKRRTQDKRRKRKQLNVQGRDLSPNQDNFDAIMDELLADMELPDASALEFTGSSLEK